MEERRYIRNLARSMIGQLRIKPLDLGQSGAHGLYANRNEEIKALLCQMRPEKLGQIASFGRAWGGDVYGTSLYGAHNATWLSKHADGMTLLREIACTAIVAEMADILRLRMELDARVNTSVSRA